MRLTAKARTVFAVGFVGRHRNRGRAGCRRRWVHRLHHSGRRRPLVERPVERDDADDGVSPLCVLDIETTGFSPERDSIIEIAVIRCETQDGSTREQVLNELVRPSGEHPETDSRADRNHERDGGGRGHHRPDAAAGRRFVGDAPIVAHNAHFDRRFLEHTARLMGMTFSGNEWVCTMVMAKRVPLGAPYRLAAVAERLDVPVRGSHRALDDCHATIGVYRVVRRLLGGSVSLAPLPPPADGPAPRRSRMTRT